MILKIRLTNDPPEPMGPPAAAVIYVKLSANPHRCCLFFAPCSPLYSRLSIGDGVRLIFRSCTSDSRLRNGFLEFTVSDSGTPAPKPRSNHKMVRWPSFLICAATCSSKHWSLWFKCTKHQASNILFPTSA